MPKMKSQRGAVKRFKAVAGGKVKRGHSHASHILTKKSPKRKRNLRKQDFVSDGDRHRIKRMIVA
ncbi:50S ribosomal protein L35 [bacterium BMS3Abin05]|nr:50S ribosomal protein L35 [bacterium BMS3Abin05]GBE27349.1 50S ribosomal protein L35 [bacterium BMS3Bbin03]HDZ13163.1 50S ribosomal protein L35 [Bacteroidota bacterium]